MNNQWEINEWGSTSNLGWLPFLDIDEEVSISIYFIAKNTINYFTTEDTIDCFTAEDITDYFTVKDNTDCFIAEDTANYFTTKGEA